MPKIRLRQGSCISSSVGCVWRGTLQQVSDDNNADDAAKEQEASKAGRYIGGRNGGHYTDPEKAVKVEGIDQEALHPVARPVVVKQAYY